MIEFHPYETFVPANASVLIVGSFPGIRQTRKLNNFEEWFYSAERNQFWKIIEAVYKTSLQTINDRKQIFTEKGIAITDIILSASRRKEGNLDEDLCDVEFNKKAIRKILENPNIKKVFFTSKFVEKHFKELFPAYKNVEYLPSPSPRYARISLKEKIEVYKDKLPE